MFLDEIGEIPLSLQSKLLRVIEGKEVLLVGATIPIQVDDRILVATNRDLDKEVEAGRFRENLYYRIPLTIRFDLLTQQLVRQIYTGYGRIATVWYEGDYRYFSSDHP